jgi:hypothetical protein
MRTLKVYIYIENSDRATNFFKHHYGSTTFRVKEEFQACIEFFCAYKNCFHYAEWLNFSSQINLQVVDTKLKIMIIFRKIAQRILMSKKFREKTLSHKNEFMTVLKSVHEFKSNFISTMKIFFEKIFFRKYSIHPNIKILNPLEIPEGNLCCFIFFEPIDLRLIKILNHHKLNYYFFFEQEFLGSELGVKLHFQNFLLNILEENHGK